jgi:hypothetical protein
MKALFVASLALCLLMLNAGPGAAFELEGYGGFYRYDNSLSEHFKADSSPIFGIRFGSGAHQILSGETTIGYGPAKDNRIVLLMGNFLINIPTTLVIPYLTLGTGTTIYLPKDVSRPDSLLLDTETKFTLNYGGGFRYFLNNLIAARFDVRDYVTFDLNFSATDAASGNPTDAVKVGTIHNMVIGGGLSLVF